uniref:RING-H2 finger protein ATL66-like n=1 Tax=Erigeron canadensis TaxID=72917 RepID=UPI001CB8AA81|nr:RING-H2 finger protein ATL66-like [Erigeron canadensis]
MTEKHCAIALVSAGLDDIFRGLHPPLFEEYVTLGCLQVGDQQAVGAAVGLPHTSSASFAISGVSLTPLSQQPQVGGLDAATINNLPIIVYQQGANETSSSECSICLGVFEDGDKLKELPSCSHCYHCECVDKWLITHSSCPICRTSVRVVDDSPPV